MTTTAMPLETAEAPGAMITKGAAKALAVLRIATGLVFLWAFLDKTFGLGYSTPGAKAWISGGSPAAGFLGHVEGPFAGVFQAMAGTWWADWLFMAALAGVGLALVLGIGLRVAAGAGTALMLAMWLAEFPPAAEGSSNPVIDYHVVYAVSAITMALTYAGNTWGLGRVWARLPLVQKNRWLV
jgi:thiosulfate dehydrogenase (quinone) large subunit